MEDNRPNHIQKAHWDEWTKGSAIDKELTALNLESISYDEPYHRLLYDWDTKRKHIDAKWRRIHRSFGKNWTHGGWWCYGGENTIWGCFKPDRPRFDPNKSKPIKYEHPHSSPTEIFRLKMPRHLWQRIANRYNIPIGNYLDFWQWVKDHPQIPIVITEGVKKAAALLSKGYVALALPGVWSGVRTPRDKYGDRTGHSYLIRELKQFAQPDRLIYLAFDQDQRRSTKQKVNDAIAKTGKLLKNSGCQVKVVSWDADYKGIDDFIVAHGNRLDQVFQSAQLLEIWQASQLNHLTYSPDLLINSRYLGSFSPPASSQLIGLKAPKGTGKTQWLSEQVKQIIREGGRKILLLTHRIQLGSELCGRLGIHYLDEPKLDDFGLWGFGLCVDSLHPKSRAKFNPSDWVGAWIILDEVEQVLWHLLNSSTCQSDRVAILRNFQEVLITALSTGGKVFLSDADLSDVSIDYIKSLIGFKIKTWIAVNEWKPSQGCDVHSYDGNSPAQLVSDLMEHISQGGKPFVCTGGQKIKSTYSTQNLESLLRRRFPHLKILRIDSESVADPNHPAYGCIERLNEILPEYDIVIASPTLETGVSISCQHFTSVWGIFPGHQPVNSVCQFLARVRANIPRYIWARKTGFGRIAGGSTNIKSILATQHKMAKANISLLTQAGFTDDIDVDFQPASLYAWAKLSARINLGMKAYRAAIEARLKDEGHNIIDPVPPSDDDDLIERIETTSDEVKATKEGNYQNHCEAIATAPDIDGKEFLKLKDQRARTKQEREQYRKAELNNRYGVEVDSDLVKKDDDGWYPLLRLHYYLGIGREHLPARDKASAQKMLDEGSGAIFKPDFNQKQLGAKIAVLDLIGFAKLLRRREFPQNDPELLAIAEFCKQHRYEIEALLGIKILPGDSPIAIAQKLLGLIGYRLPRLRREGSRDNRQYIYGAAAPSFRKNCQGKLQLDDSGQAIPIPDGRDEVFTAWLSRDRDRADSESVSTGHNNSVYITTHGHNPMDTEPDIPMETGRASVSTGHNNSIDITTHGHETMDAAPHTPTERLLESLSRVSSFGQFWEVIRGYEDETVEDAIALQDNHSRRQTLAAWFEGDASVTLPEVALDPFLEPESVQDLVGLLKICCREGKALFDILRQTIPSTEAFRRAVRFLDRERRAVIRYWEPGLA
jgi:hypothetical protein